MPGTGAIIAGAAFVKLTLDNADLKKGLEESQSKLGEFAAKINAFASKMTMLGPLMATPFVAATRAFAAFDDQMRLTGAVTGATGKQFQDLTEQAKKLGRETSFTAAQVAGGMTALGRMGFNPQEIQAAIKPMMNLAASTGTELSVAAEIAANAMRALGLDTSKTADVVDVLMTTANGSAQTLTDLGEALKYAAPAARTAGETITDANAALGVLANVGIKGSMAGNALKRAYSELAKTDVQDYLKQYGIQAVDATGNLRKMADVLRDCAVAMANMGSAEKLNFATQVFGERAAPAALAITADTSKIDEMLKKLQNCKGAAQAAADQMESGLGGALRRLSSSAEGVSIALGEIIATSFTPVIESVSAFCLAIRSAIGSQKELVTGLLGIGGSVIGFGLAVKAVSLLVSGIKSMFAPLQALNALIVNSAGKAAALAVQEQQKAAATAARIAKQTALEKQATANEAAETAKRMNIAAQEEIAKLNKLKSQRAANDMTIADSRRIIAAKQAETAAIIAEEQKIIAAQTGKRGRGAAEAVANAEAKIQVVQAECTATVAAETEKQAAIQQTNLALNQQITEQNAVAGAAAKSAAASSAAATKAAADYNGAAAAANSAARAELSLAAAQQTGTKNSLVRLAAMGKLTTATLFGAACSGKHAKAVLSASLTELVAAKTGAGASALKTAGYYTEAVAAKVAAAATLTLKAALDFLMANPVTIAFLAIAAAVWAVCKAVNSTTEAYKKEAEAAQEASKAATEAREAGDTKRQGGEVDFKRLEQLEEISARGKLSAEEMAEAERLINRLDPYGASQWASLDKVTGQLHLAADAQKQFNDQMREAARMELEAEIMKQEQAIEKLRASLSDSMWRNVGSWFGMDNTDEHNAPIHKEIDALFKKLLASRKRLKALQEGSKEAVTGEQGQTTADRVSAAEEQRRATTQQLADAERELARMDEENAKKKMTQLEQEIAGIEKMKAKYLELAELKKKDLQADLKAAQTRMQQNAKGETPAQKAAYEEAKRAAEAAQAGLDALDQRISAATASYEQQAEAARQKDADRKKKEAEAKARSEAKYTGFLQDTEKKEQARAAEKAQDQQFDKLNKDKTPEGVQALNAFMQQLSGSLEAAKQHYQQMLDQFKNADSEGGADLSENEKKQLEAQQRAITEATAKLNSYRDRIGGGIQAAQQKQQTLASFDANALTSLFDKSGFAATTREERIAKATEETAKNTKKLTQGSGLLVG